MKFEFRENAIQFQAKDKRVSLPVEAFTKLIDYVDDLEDQLLAREINLEKAEELAAEMEESGDPGTGVSSIGDSELKILERISSEFGSPNQSLLEALREKNVSIRRIHMMTSIPYATVYRYVHGQEKLDVATLTRIVRAVESVKSGRSKS